MYGGGGSSTGTFNSDYVELHNNSGTPQDISGYKIIYGSATGVLGSVATNNFTFPSNVIIPAGSYTTQLGNFYDTTSQGTCGLNAKIIVGNTTYFASRGVSRGSGYTYGGQGAGTARYGNIGGTGNADPWGTFLTQSMFPALSLDNVTIYNGQMYFGGGGTAPYGNNSIVNSHIGGIGGGGSGGSGGCGGASSSGVFDLVETEANFTGV